MTDDDEYLGSGPGKFTELNPSAEKLFDVPEPDLATTIRDAKYHPDSSEKSSRLEDYYDLGQVEQEQRIVEQGAFALLLLLLPVIVPAILIRRLGRWCKQKLPSGVTEA